MIWFLSIVPFFSAPQFSISKISFIEIVTYLFGYGIPLIANIIYISIGGYGKSHLFCFTKENDDKLNASSTLSASNRRRVNLFNSNIKLDRKKIDFKFRSPKSKIFINKNGANNFLLRFLFHLWKEFTVLNSFFISTCSVLSHFTNCN